MQEADSIVEASEIPSDNRIYLDVSSIRSDIPDTMYYVLYNEEEEDYIEGKMSLCKGYNHIYYVDVPDGYTQVRFCTEEQESNESESTDRMEIPKENRCFYMDNEVPSSIIGITRSGYWDKPFKLRNPESAKSAKSEGEYESTSEFQNITEQVRPKNDDIEYVNCSLYDYYTDSELNGYPRSQTYWNNYPSYSGWYPFRIFDMALSDEYKKSNGIPLYIGHFEPSPYMGSYSYREIAHFFRLKGWDNDDPYPFFSTNNSQYDVNGKTSSDYYSAAAQGLIYPSLRNGALMDSSGSIVLPYFNENFLNGDNSRNEIIGKTFHNVSFPFHKTTTDGITRYSFDADSDHASLSRDSEGLFLYLNDKNSKWCRNWDSSGNWTYTNGFFPFNDLSTNSVDQTNYGFGMKLEFDFSVPNNGTFPDGTPVTFNFSGDDDLWIFIDGNLALDVGGDHGKTSGTLNFANKTAIVSNVKASQGDQDAVLGPKTTSFELSDSDTHHLTMFYMERGMWESNLQMNYTIVPKTCKVKLNKTFTGNEKSDISFDLAGPDDFHETYPLSSFAKTDETYSLSLSGLPCGDYTLKEQNADQNGLVRKTTFTVGEKSSDGDVISFTGSDGQEIVVNVKNEYITPPKITIQKLFTGDKIPDSIKNNIAFTITNTATNEIKLIPYSSFNDDGTYTITDLPEGTYRVKENEGAVKGYTHVVTYSEKDGIIKTENGKDADITIINQYERTARLPVTGLPGTSRMILAGFALVVLACTFMVYCYERKHNRGV